MPKKQNCCSISRLHLSHRVAFSFQSLEICSGLMLSWRLITVIICAFEAPRLLILHCGTSSGSGIFLLYPHRQLKWPISYITKDEAKTTLIGVQLYSNWSRAVTITGCHMLIRWSTHDYYSNIPGYGETRREITGNKYDKDIVGEYLFIFIPKPSMVTPQNFGHPTSDLDFPYLFSDLIAIIKWSDFHCVI